MGAFGQMAAPLPETPEREGQAGSLVRVASRDVPLQGGAHVVVLAREYIEPALLVVAPEMRPRLLGERKERGGMPPRNLLGFPALGQASERVLADRDEHPETRLALDLRLPNEALLDECAEDVEDIGLAADRFDLWKHRAGDKHGKAAGEALLACPQEIPAPRPRHE